MNTETQRQIGNEIASAAEQFVERMKGVTMLMAMAVVQQMMDGDAPAGSTWYSMPGPTQAIAPIPQKRGPGRPKKNATATVHRAEPPQRKLSAQARENMRAGAKKRWAKANKAKATDNKHTKATNGAAVPATS